MALPIYWSSTRSLRNPVLLSNRYLRSLNARYFNAGSESASKHAIRCQRYCIVLPNCVPLTAIHGLALPKCDPLEQRRQ
ncbi:hypothetical protein CEXT_251711 [Caerostris extrusa]|uniref:Uncharacterized protein n=1 Tax=Caerostris extrusa TaxID=172846 RepID=A0AAV4QZP1_CAEEX|nr:hypothetical protein CEXT_251711 [Caerostris extrusa]